MLIQVVNQVSVFAQGMMKIFPWNFVSLLRMRIGTSQRAHVRALELFVAHRISFNALTLFLFLQFDLVSHFVSWHHVVLQALREVLMIQHFMVCILHILYLLNLRVRLLSALVENGVALYGDLELVHVRLSERRFQLVVLLQGCLDFFFLCTLCFIEHIWFCVIKTMYWIECWLMHRFLSERTLRSFDLSFTPLLRIMIRRSGGVAGRRHDMRFIESFVFFCYGSTSFDKFLSIIRGKFILESSHRHFFSRLRLGRPVHQLLRSETILWTFHIT